MTSSSQPVSEYADIDRKPNFNGTLAFFGGAQIMMVEEFGAWGQVIKKLKEPICFQEER